MAREFDAASEHYLLNATAPLNFQPMTISVWFKIEAQVTQNIVFLGNNTASADYWILRMGGAKLQWSARDVDASTASSNDDVTVDVWHHGCGMESSNSERYAFLDGDRGPNGSGFRSPDGAKAVSIGCLTTTSPSSYFTGAIAELAIWNVELTPAEVLYLSTGASPLWVRPASLRRYWPLIGDATAEPDIMESKSMSIFNGATTSRHPPIFRLVDQTPLGLSSPPSIAAYRRRLIIASG